jgi:anti-sigma regulatory factor (Ser/Thr protein kinase)
MLSALVDLRRLRRRIAGDADAFKVSLGVGTGLTLCLLAVFTASEGLSRLRTAPEHRTLLHRWGDRAWWQAWEPDGEFGQWQDRRLREGLLARAPVAVDEVLPVDARAPYLARRALRATFHWVDQRALQVLELLLSELVGNSYRHSGLGSDDGIRVQVRTADGWFRGEVIDRGRGFEPHIPADKSSNDGSGWGLYTVDRLADRWGLIQGQKDQRVWFEMRVARGERGSEARSAIASGEPARAETQLHE